MSTAQKVIDILATADLARIRAPAVMESLGIGRRAFEQRLEREGTCYAELLREERMCRVRALLKANKHADGRMLAKKCGYLKTSNAYQAFKKWFGVNWRDVKHVGLPSDS